jgi:hypothetical protein
LQCALHITNIRRPNDQSEGRKLEKNSFSDRALFRGHVLNPTFKGVLYVNGTESMAPAGGNQVGASGEIEKRNRRRHLRDKGTN